MGISIHQEEKQIKPTCSLQNHLHSNFSLFLWCLQKRDTKKEKENE